MASSVGGDLSQIKTGPCAIKVGGAFVGHTMEGVSFTIQPDLRERMVDEYGTNVVDLIHQGDNVEVTTTMAEFTLAVLGVVYVWGYQDNSQTWGIGRVPGSYSGSELNGSSPVAKVLLLHPLSEGADTSGDVTFFRAVVTDSGQVQFGVITEDRVFECTWKCLIDPDQIDGKLIGTIGIPD